MKGLWLLVGLLFLLASACAASAPPTPRPIPTPEPTHTPTAIPTATPTPTPLPTPTPVPKLTLGQIEASVRQSSKEYRYFFATLETASGVPGYDILRPAYEPSAVYGFLLAPFLRPELSAQQLGRLTMAQFLPQGLESVPTPKQINEALLRAASADPRTLTKAQAELAQVLRRPESNEMVFQMAIAPMLAGSNPFMGTIFQRHYETQFGKFQSRNPKESFLEALAAGLDGFTALPGFPGGS